MSRVALDSPVLVLNRNYAVIHMVTCRRALSLLYRETAEVVHVEEDQYDCHRFQEWVIRSAGISRSKKLTHGPARFGSVKLAQPDTKMQIAESVEDGLALMQMNALPTLAVPGTSFLASRVVPPRECQTVVLAPDNDEAGQKAIKEATPRLHTLGFTVRVLLPPPCRDWCDVLPEFEERRAIVEEEFYG